MTKSLYLIGWNISSLDKKKNQYDPWSVNEYLHKNELFLIIANA